MVSRQLIRTDLNLLVALQILLEERNVTRAAERMSVSQPALSKTLQKLRYSFNDELFTRTSRGLVPTPRAEALAEVLPALLDELELVLGGEEFEPLTYTGTFKLLLSPVLSEVLLPGLMAELQQFAPQVRIVAGEVSTDYQELLKKGEVDFVAFIANGEQGELVADPIAPLPPRCYMGRHHPLAEGEFGLEEFLAYPHIFLYLPGMRQNRGSMVDRVLEQHGQQRTIALETTQFAAALGVLSQTDYLLVANTRTEDRGLYRESVVGRELPAEMQRMIHDDEQRIRRGGMALMHHPRAGSSLPHQWLRQILIRHLTTDQIAARVDSGAEKSLAD